MCFVDIKKAFDIYLGKAFDRVPRKVLGDAEKKRIIIIMVILKCYFSRAHSPFI